jgi:hypothetical protein
MRPGREVDRSLLSSAEVKKNCIYNFITSVRLRGDLRDKSVYTFYLNSTFISTGTAGPEGSSVLTVVNRLLYTKHIF